jgi:hypothetical protein
LEVAAHVTADALVTVPGLFVIALISTLIMYPLVGLSHEGYGGFVFCMALFMSLFGSSFAVV